MRDPARRLGGRLYLRQHGTGVVEKHASRRGQFDAASAAREKLGPDLLLEVADLTAERRLRGVQPSLGGQAEALGLGDGNEVTLGAVVPSFTPMLGKYRWATYKVSLEDATPSPPGHLMR